jgi:hypothetical protein
VRREWQRHWPSPEPEKEVKRQAVNAWIRTSGEYDGVIDLIVCYVGYNALANGINLKLFRDDQGQR